MSEGLCVNVFVVAGRREEEMCELLWVFEFLSYLCDFRRQKWLWVVSWGLPSFEFHSMSEGLCAFVC